MCLELFSIETRFNKDKTIGIFLDLSKAFDTVSVPLLLDKLERIGVRGLPLDLFKSYLTERSQVVLLDGYTSREVSLTYGVPQGSVLGPSLFLVYINELCKLSAANSKVITYADDTVILVHGRDWKEARLLAESALQKIMKWLTQNLLTLNLDKTRFIAFGPKQASQPSPNYCLIAHVCDSGPNVACTCARVVRTDSIRYLGVVVDSKLSWSEEVNYLVSRVRRLIFVFKNLRSSANVSTLKTVYFALAHSVLTYCITAWGGAGKCLLLRLERAQRAVLKVMAHKPIHFPTHDLYSLWKIPTVRQSFILCTMLRKHSELPYAPNATIERRRGCRPDRVCGIVPAKLEVVRRQYNFFSSRLYNGVNSVLHIHSRSYRDFKKLTDDWLQTLTYEDLERLVKP